MRVGEGESGRRMQDWLRTRVAVGSSRGAAQEIGLGSAQVPCTWVGMYPARQAASQQLMAVGCWEGVGGDRPMEKRWEETLNWDRWVWVSR